MKDGNQAFVNIKYLWDENILQVIVSENIRRKTINMLSRFIPTELLQASHEFKDFTSESGEFYRLINIYRIPVYHDKITPIFDAALSMYSKTVKDSIINSDN